MNIDLLSKMIGTLILEVDEVYLPGLGAFVAEEIEAGFSDKGFTINPPYRRLSFRQKDVQDDALSRLYARENAIPEEEAEVIVNGFLKQLGIVLKDKKNVMLPGLGRLRATKQNHIFFVQDQDVDIFPQGFGLESLSLKSLAASKGAEPLRPVSADMAPEPFQEDISSQPAPSEALPPETIPSEPAPSETASSETVLSEQVTPERKHEPVPVLGTATLIEPVAVRKKTASALDKKNGWKMALAVVAVLVLLFFIAVAIIGSVAPDFIDPFLYSPEELELLNYLK